MTRNTLHIWNRLAPWPAGKWLFSRLLCLKVPYFASISPRLVELRPEYCEVRMRKHRAVRNHLGTVHAIAICNLAELAAGTMIDATLPATHRWIPKGMTVQYLRKAGTHLRAIATPATPLKLDAPDEYHINVAVTDVHAALVFSADITMWITPRK